MNVFTEKILGSPLSWAPGAIGGSALGGKVPHIAMDLQASRQLWNGRRAG